MYHMYAWYLIRHRGGAWILTTAKPGFPNLSASGPARNGVNHRQAIDLLA